MTKKVIRVRVADLYYGSLDGKIENAITYLKILQESYGQDAEIEFNVYNDSADLDVYIRREETDAEYEHRLLVEKKQAEYRENQERQQYEALKKKFETEGI